MKERVRYEGHIRQESNGRAQGLENISTWKKASAKPKARQTRPPSKRICRRTKVRSLTQEMKELRKFKE